MRPLPLLASMLALRRGLAMSTAGPRELRITQALTSAFAPQHLEVLNESHGRREDESHFKVVVVSDKFEGVRPLIKRHRLVTAAITADTGSQLDFHSLSVGAAKTPEMAERERLRRAQVNNSRLHKSASDGDTLVISRRKVVALERDRHVVATNIICPPEINIIWPRRTHVTDQFLLAV